MGTKIKFNEQKLDTIIKNNGMTDAEFSVSIGHSKDFLRKVRKNGYVTQTTRDFIKTVYGVDITLKEQPKVEEPTKDNADVSSDAMKKLDLIANSITQFSKNNNDADLDVIERLEKLEKTTADISISLRTIGNLLTQINEKVMRK